MYTHAYLQQQNKAFFNCTDEELTAILENTKQGKATLLDNGNVIVPEQFSNDVKAHLFNNGGFIEHNGYGYTKLNKQTINL